ncbi:MAG TPA: SAM-dependent methyltransferase [Streptosporangiaceae bacterium]
MADDRDGEGSAEGDRLAAFDTGVAHSSRVYNYWLGGKDNFAADRAAAELAIEAFPQIVVSARANRAFLGRAVRFLAGEAGIRQFLDIGTGIPAASNTHEVAQAIAPESRVLYVDNDPIVLAHARALLASNPAGATDYIDADLRDPRTILEAAAGLLDFSEPVAVMLLAILHFIGDDDKPHEIVAELMSALAPGSYLAITHGTADITFVGEDVSNATIDGLNQAMVENITVRDRATVARFFDGLELVEPGLVPVSAWREASAAEAGQPVVLWAGVGRKPPG